MNNRTKLSAIKNPFKKSTSPLLEGKFDPEQMKGFNVEGGERGTTHDEICQLNG